MQVTQTATDGLKREFKVIVPAGSIEDKVANRLEDLGRTIRMPGFRPGKVPMTLLRKRYGPSVMGEVLEATVNDATRQAMTDHNLRPAMQPKIEITSYAEGKDLEFTVALETLPEITPADFSTIELERPVAEVPEEEIDKTLDRLAAGREGSEPAPEGRKAQEGDIAVIDFLGKVDGVAFEGGKGEDYSLKLGSGTFIPGFEQQLVGAGAGDQVTVKVSFPSDYGHAPLAGKEAEFDVTVKEIRVAVPAAIDDELAKSLGMDDLDALRKAVRDQIERQYASLSRNHLKRRLLDALAERHDFEVPQVMADMEFDAIWKQIEESKEAGKLDPEDQGKSDDDLKAEYRKIAERRVRLGLLLSEVGQKAEITVTQEDLNRAIVAEAGRFPGQEHMVFRYFQENQEAMNSLRAPIFEEKVIDYIIELAKVADRPVSIEELMKEPDGDKAVAEA
ncbi:MAG: trigger factor [Rhodospirillales bacterium]|nr:trigger factor [Rhodospirillales bacterium]